MMKPFLLAAVLGPTALVPTALYAQNQTQPSNPQGGPAQQNQVSAADFVNRAAMSNRFEIQSSQAAQQKAQNERVRQFAQRMIQEHTSAGDRLRSTAQSIQGVTIPSNLDQRHQQMLQTLQNASGMGFDRNYVQLQIGAHRDAVNLFDQYAQNGDNQQLKQFAQQTLPTLREHLQQIQQIQTQLPPAQVGQTQDGQQAQGQQAAQNQQGGSRIVVQQSAPTVRVDPADPRITVRQPQPQVTVNQAQPEIIVRQPQPTVRVDIPQPEIIVRMPRPDVNVAVAPPQVQVLMERPDIAVLPPSQPQVQVDRAQPQVFVQRPANAEPSVQVQRGEGQPIVRYERAEPRVIVNQAQGQPTVRIERAGQAQADGNLIRPMAVSEIKGKDVYNARGEDLGEIERVILGKGDEAFGVIRFDEFLGLGGEARILPLSGMTLRDDRIIIPGMTEVELRALPEYREDIAGYREAEPNYRANLASYYAAADRAHDQAGVTVNERAGAGWNFATFDRDRNGMLVREEFNPFAARVYSGWDANTNKRLERNEFYGGLYGVWDMNRDNRLTEAEYDQAWSTWGDGIDRIEFGQVDRNRDGFLDRQEFAGGWGDNGLYERWDADRGGWLAENEFGSGLFSLWDERGQVAENTFSPWLAYGWGGQAAAANLNRSEQRRDPMATGAVGAVRSFRVNDLENMSVYSLRGQKIGEVKRLVRRIGDNQGYVVLEHGGFLGLGEKEVPLPLNRVFMMGDRLVAAGMTQAEVTASADWDFNDREYREFGNDETVELGLRG